MAVRNSLLEKLSGKLRRCRKNVHRFSGSTKCYPCQGLGISRQGKSLLENRPRLRERSWIFSSETATAFLSFWGSPKASHIKASHPHFPHFPRLRVRIFRIFRVFALRNLLRPLFSWAERDFPHFPRFPRIGFESLISKIRPTGFRMTGHSLLEFF